MDNAESNLSGNMDVAEEPPGKWDDWRWQLKHRVKSIDDAVKKELPISQEASQAFPLSITPYYLSLIEHYNSSDPIYRMCVPDIAELSGECCVSDPLQEDQQMPVPNLVHRYKDRALIICTTVCSVYCRYCTRKRTVSSPYHCKLDDLDVAFIKDYLQNHPEITDVILSGGDPMILDTYDLRFILSQIRAVDSVQIIRIGTKCPVVLPMRIDDELVETLKDFQPIFVNTHFNHPREITAQSQAACAKLIDNGIPVNNQSVLLKGVNDDKFIQEELCRKLIRMRVRPYYLFQCDLVNGANHFRTKIAKGIEIMEHLRGRLSGLAIPQYVIDTPGGKIPILPTYLISQTPEKVILRNFEGKIMEYPEI